MTEFYRKKTKKTIDRILQEKNRRFHYLLPMEIYMKGAFLNRTCHSLIKWLKLLNNVDPHFLFYYFFQFTSMPHNFHFTSLPHNFHFTSMPHNFHFTSMQPGACEGFCLGGGTICARPLGNIGPPLKNPFLKKY